MPILASLMCVAMGRVRSSDAVMGLMSGEWITGRAVRFLCLLPVVST